MRLQSAPSCAVLSLAVAGILLRPAIGAAQRSWDHDRPRSLASVITEEREDVIRALAADPDRGIALYGRSFPSLPTIEYADSIRTTSPARLDLIRRWIESYHVDPQLFDAFGREMLFREDGSEVWLPVQSSLIEQIETDYARGDRLTLFLVWVGAIGTGAELDWLFLVYGVRSGARD